MTRKTSLYLGAAALALTMGAGEAHASYCSDGKTVTFAGIDWESGAFITEVMKRIFADGYGCKVDQIPGNSVTLEQATANNDVQIFAEEWIGRSDVWNEAAAAGKVKSVGKTFVGASEGWFVPAYVVKGDPARNIAPLAPDLKAVAQLSSADGKRDEACAFPSVEVAYGINSTFAEEAPDLVAVLEKAEFPLDEVNKSLAFMVDTKSDAAMAATEFLKSKADIWGPWVTEDARAKIEASLK